MQVVNRASVEHEVRAMNIKQSLLERSSSSNIVVWPTQLFSADWAGVFSAANVSKIQYIGRFGSDPSPSRFGVDISNQK